MKNLILVTGGNGRFAQILKKKSDLKFKFLSKNELDILRPNSINKCLLKYKPRILIHTAGLSRPMHQHETNIAKSIDLNIIGTANIVKLCKKYNIKLIYFSTCYVYDGIKGNHKESEGLNPINNYALSKMGGESSVRMYNNSLVLRIQMIEWPFPYKKAYSNLYSNYIFHKDVAKLLPKLLNKNGIINIGGKSQSTYNFVKKYNKYIVKAKINDKETPLKQTMNLDKLKKILKKNINS